MDKGFVVDPLVQHFQQPVVIHIIKETLDIGFYNITINSKLELKRQLAHGNSGIFPRAITVAEREEILLVDCVQESDTGSLNDLVL